MLVAEVTAKVPPIRSHIASDDELEFKRWTKHFRVTREELQNVIEKVGNSAAAVRKELATAREQRRNDKRSRLRMTRF